VLGDVRKGLAAFILTLLPFLGLLVPLGGQVEQ
jgi:hypothetical protein